MNHHPTCTSFDLHCHSCFVYLQAVSDLRGVFLKRLHKYSISALKRICRTEFHNYSGIVGIVETCLIHNSPLPVYGMSFDRNWPVAVEITFLLPGRACKTESNTRNCNPRAAREPPDPVLCSEGHSVQGDVE